jgi:hypothetical protein
MASETYYTPQAPARWAHLINAREQLDPSKPKAWTVELVLDPGANAKHKAFLEKLETIFNETHGTKKKRSDKGQPWKADRENPDLVVVKFKSNEFIRDDGSKSAGPRIIDARKTPWDGSAIGNGSELVLAFTTYGWERPEGTGLSLQPKAAQVVKFVPREEQDATEGFDEVEGGYAVADAGGFVDEFANPDELGI